MTVDDLLAQSRFRTERDDGTLVWENSGRASDMWEQLQRVGQPWGSSTQQTAITPGGGSMILRPGLEPTITIRTPGSVDNVIGFPN